MTNVRTLHVIYSDPANYPPTINACRVWSAANNEVCLLGFNRGTHRYFSAGNGIREYYGNTPPGDWPNSFASKVRGLLRLRSLARQLVRQFRPHVVFAYDLHAVWATLPLANETPIVGHFHDMPIGPLSNSGRLDGKLYKAVTRHINRLSAIIMPEAKRMEIATSLWGINCKNFVVPNCSRRANCESNSILRALLRERTAAPIGHIVVRVGGAGPENMVEDSVKALGYLAPDYHLCLIGCGDEVYSQELVKIADAVGRSANLHLFSFLNYDDMRAYLRSASLGLALYSPHSADLNKQHQATASDKFMEYLAAGLPIVACPHAGFVELGLQTGGVVLIAKDDPAGIAEAIRKATCSTETHRRLGEEAYAAHVREFNYEHHYAPVMSYVASLTH